MGELEKLFDTYSLNARVKPAFLLVFPIVITIFTFFEPSRSWGGIAVTFIVSFGIISFAANQLSTKGSILQEKLFKKWGGAPTTIILRHSDSRLDKHTKKRYMTRLEELIPNFTAVTLEQEKNNQHEADQMYSTAANYLREHTRDVKKYPLVFKENIQYGFSRNIRAFKWIGLIISFISLCISLFVIWYRSENKDSFFLSGLLFNTPFEHLALVLLLSLILLAWIFAVTEKWVEVRGFAYARALLASCEKIV